MSTISSVREFNRFYTNQIGILGENILRSRFSLAEARVLYELAHQDRLLAARLAQELALDPGYLSRILRRFLTQRLIRRTPSTTDRRQTFLSLSAKGRRAFASLNARSDEEVRAMLRPLPAAARRQLIDAMAAIERTLGAPPAPQSPCILRRHRAGDMGWVVHRQAVLYAQEYGWDERFEAFVAEIVAQFIRGYDHQRERCWIAEREGEPLGSVFLVRESDSVAKLRLLFVESHARGLGLGRRLVEECIRFARRAGYSKITLWTNDILTAARRIYQSTGFRLVEETPHESFGHHLVGQNWELDL